MEHLASSFNQLCSLVKVDASTTHFYGTNGISLLTSSTETVEPIAVREFTLKREMSSLVVWSKLIKKRTPGRSLQSEKKLEKPPNTPAFLELTRS